VEWPQLYVSERFESSTRWRKGGGAPFQAKHACRRVRAPLVRQPLVAHCWRGLHHCWVYHERTHQQQQREPHKRTPLKFMGLKARAGGEGGGKAGKDGRVVRRRWVSCGNGVAAEWPQPCVFARFGRITRRGKRRGSNSSLARVPLRGAPPRASTTATRRRRAATATWVCHERAVQAAGEEDTEANTLEMGGFEGASGPGGEWTQPARAGVLSRDRKSTRLNSSHT